MRKLMALLWSSVSVVSGLLGELPSVPALSYPRLATAQVVASEDFIVGLLAGIVGVWKGMRARSGWAILLGLIGIGLGARRLVRREMTNELLSDAMRDGLGPGWQREIRPRSTASLGRRIEPTCWDRCARCLAWGCVKRAMCCSPRRVDIRCGWISTSQKRQPVGVLR